jgi:hypothetical protein
LEAALLLISEAALLLISEAALLLLLLLLGPLSLTSLQSLPKWLSIASLSEKRPEGYPKAHCPPRSYKQLPDASDGVASSWGTRVNGRFSKFKLYWG